MRRIAWRLLAAASLLAVASAATRPHYGGTLRVQTRERSAPRDLVFDPLVTFNDSAKPQPALAIVWKHDADFKRWEFQLRPRVKFHDGTLLTGSIAAAALESLGAIASGDTVVIRSDVAAPNLLQKLSALSISKRTADGALVGTGPFRPGTGTVFQANEDYWGGRPYLDAVEIEMGRSLRDQALDFDLNKADVVELGVGDTRRASQGGKRLWTSVPVTLIALVFNTSVEERLREAIAFSIDRTAIHTVLLQRQGVPAGSILPQWLSGYAFLFPSARDLDRARQLASAAPVTIGYDPADATARLIAERIAVNAREAGLVVHPTAAAQTAGRIVRVNVSTPDPMQALTSLDGVHSDGFPFDVEREIIRSHRIIPLFHLPEIYGLGPRVRGFAPSRWGEWKLDSVWLTP